MKRGQKVRDLTEKKLFVEIEERVSDLEDNVVDLKCAVCDMEKEDDKQRCLMCGSFKTIVTVF